MKNDVIKELLVDGIPWAEKCVPDSEKYRTLARKVSDISEKFQSMLNEEQKKCLEEFWEYRLEETTMEMDENFRQGVSFGIRLTAEAFLIAKE